MYYLQTKASFDAAHFYGNTKENAEISTDIVGMLLQNQKSGAGARRTDTRNGSGLW